MIDDFKSLQLLVNELNSTNATNEKMEIFRGYVHDPFIRKIHQYVYTPFKQYYITPDNLKKNSNLETENKYESIFGLLDDLAERIHTGHTAISLVNGFITEHEEYKELIYNIFDRNLKTRFTDSLVNKVVPGLVPTFDCVLANSYDDRPDKVDFGTQEWLSSRKLDGIRCLIVVDEDGTVIPFSRNGKPILTIEKVVDDIKKLDVCEVVFDGELCIVDEDGNEQFQGVVSQFGRKDHQILSPRYKIFDMIPLEEFRNQRGLTKFSDRILALEDEFLYIGYDGDCLDIVKQTKVTSKKHLEELRDKAKNEGWEGIMIRLDTGYKGKRTNDLLKCKKFFDAEYVVNDIEVGPFFSLEQRRQYRDNPDLIVNKEITVCYFEETKDKHGDLSLRFPTFKGVYNGKRFDNE